MKPIEYGWGMIEWLVSAERGGARELSVARMQMLPGAVTEPHRHPDCEEVITVLEGTVTCERAGSRSAHGAGECIVIPRDTVHRLIGGNERATLLLAYSSAARTYVAAAD